ncbi:hypothetical protein Q5752_004156 [Cryptotrichosporon argae]
MSASTSLAPPGPSGSQQPQQLPPTQTQQVPPHAPGPPPTQPQPQPLLLPSLHALLDPSAHLLVLSRASLRVLHAEPLRLTETVYMPPARGARGMPYVHVRRERRTRGGGFRAALGRGGELGESSSGRVHAADRAVTVDSAAADKTDKADKPDTTDKAEEADEEHVTAAYVSAPLAGQEYAEMRVVATSPVALGAATGACAEAVDRAVRGLGYEPSHSYILRGHRFHLPLPSPHTLHLTITRLVLPSDDEAGTSASTGTGDDDGAEKTAAPASASAAPTGPTPALAHTPSSEPYLVRLEPARPVAGAPAPGQMGLREAMDAMHEAAAGIEGVEWVSGR